MAAYLATDAQYLTPDKQNHDRNDTGTGTPILAQYQCHLFRLPLEVRDMLYDKLFTEGFTEISRTCKAIHEEAKQRLIASGVFRFCSETSFRMPVALPPPIIAESIQNVELRVKPRHPLCRGETSKIGETSKLALEQFRGSNIRRKACKVVFVCYGDFPSGGQFFVWKAVSDFRGFESVVVKLEVWRRGSSGEGDLEEDELNRLEWEEICFGIVERILTPSLGTATRSETEEASMIFHPRALGADTGDSKD